VKHRTDLTYILDMLGGELSVGHSFVGGGDNPQVDSSRVGALGADLVAEGRDTAPDGLDGRRHAAEHRGPEHASGRASRTIAIW